MQLIGINGKAGEAIYKYQSKRYININQRDGFTEQKQQKGRRKGIEIEWKSNRKEWKKSGKRVE